MFSKMKTSLRTAARRTIEDLRPVIGELMDAFTTDECDRYIGHAGYGKST
jgi:hypothetical protein